MRRQICLFFAVFLLLSGCGSPEPPEAPGTPAPPETPADTPIPIILTHSDEADSMTHQIAVYYAQQVEERTEGRYRFHIYPAGAMGGEEDQPYAIREGTVSMHLGSDLSSVLQVLSSPAILEDITELLYLVETPAVRELIWEESATRGVTFVGVLSAEYRVLTANRPVTSISDFQGLRIGTLDSFSAYWEALGATPVLCQSDERHTAFQQNLINAQTDVLKENLTGRLHNYQSHLIYTNDSIFWRSLFMNQSFYQELPDHDRAIFFAVVPKVRAYAQSLLEDFHTALTAELTELGMTVTEPDSQLRSDLREIPYEAVIEELKMTYSADFIESILAAISQ